MSLLRRHSVIGSNWNPILLGNKLLKWFDLEDSTVVVDNGGTITVYDKSAGMEIATLTTAKNIDADGYVSGEGSLNEFASLGIKNVNIHKQKDLEYFIKTKVDGVGGYPIILCDPGTDQDYFRLGVLGDGRSHFTIWESGEGAADTVTSTTTFEVGSIITHNVRYDVLESAYKLEINGVNYTSEWVADPDYTDLNNSTTDEFGHFEQINSGLLSRISDTYYNWGFIQILITKALTDDERLQLTNYLK